ncbi:MAG: thiamine pyrophosphate-binding protein [Cellvibrionaceae bacterium]
MSTSKITPTEKTSFSSSAYAASQPNVSDLLVSYLKQLNVEFVFGVPGGAIEPFYNSLAKSSQENGPRPITARHETGAVFMAEGYHTQTGKIGVCCGTTGPGTTNLITGIASAYANHIPLLVITAQTALTTFGRQAFQESSCTGINTIAMLEPCTRYNSLVSHPEQLELKLVSAIMTAFGPSPGPVHLSIPIDIMNSTECSSEPKFNLNELIRPLPALNSSHIEALAERLESATKTVFVLGDGAIHAISNIITVAQIFNVEIITTPHGKGLISPYHHAYRGVYGFAGHDSAEQALLDPQVDTVVCIGATFSEWATNSWNTQALLNEKIVHIDQHEKNFTLTPMANSHIHGSIESVFDELLQFVSKKIQPSEIIKAEHLTHTTKKLPFLIDDNDGFLQDSTPIHPARLMRELPNVLPPNTRYLADVGASFAWAIHYLHPFDRRLKGSRNIAGGLFRTCIEFSSMGWAIGCAVGAALALKNQPVVCITGDGSFLMSGQEITVAVQEKLPVIFVILNDQALGMVKHGQQLTGAEPVGYEIPAVNFADFGKAMGVTSFQIHKPSDLKELGEINFEKLQEPILLDIHIDLEAVPPIGKRTRSLSTCQHKE